MFSLTTESNKKIKKSKSLYIIFSKDIEVT